VGSAQRYRSESGLQNFLLHLLSTLIGCFRTQVRYDGAGGTLLRRR
jgi:hypothetical protein